MQKANIEELLKEAESYDQDHKFMAANDLCAELLKANNGFDNRTVEKICTALLKQLDDNTAEIKGNAIKCLAKIVSKIPESLVGEVCKKLINNVINPKKEDIKNIDIYATCLKTLIQEVTESFAEIMCKTLANSGLSKRLQENEINEELIDITNVLVKRFTGFLSKNSNILNKEFLIKDLLTRIKEDKPSIRKKASTCLGTLSLILPQKDTIAIAETLVQGMIANKDKKDQKELILYTIAFNAIVKNVGQKLGSIIPKILPTIIQDIEKRRNSEPDDYHIQNELIDYYLSIIEGLIKRCSQDITPFLNNILKSIHELIKYDPNIVDDEAMEVEENEEDDEYESDEYDNDDSSWKVRRSAIHVVDTLIRTRPDLIKEISQNLLEKLISRFKEKELSVKLDLFNTISNFLESIVVGEYKDEIDEIHDLPPLLKMKSSTGDISYQLDNMIIQLIKVFKKTKNPSSLKISGSNLLVHSAKCIPNHVVNQLNALLPIIKSYFQSESIPSELKVNMLISLKRLIRYQAHTKTTTLDNYFKQILEICTKAINHTHFKISSEGFRLLSAFYRILRVDRRDGIGQTNYATYVKPILYIILGRLKETDIDQEIKYAVISNVSVLISTFGDCLDVQTTQDIFLQLFNKLKSEVTRPQTLKAFSKIPVYELSLPTSNQLYELWSTIITELTSYLQKQDRSLKVSALEVLKIMVELMKNALNPNLQSIILNQIIQFLKDEDFYLAQLSIDLIIKILSLDTNNKTKEIDIAIDNCINLTKSSFIQGNTIQKLIDLFNLIGKKDFPIDKLIQKLCENNNKNNMNSTSKCIAALILNTNPKNKKELIEYFKAQLPINKNPNNTLREISLLTISEIGKKVNFSSDKNLLQQILSLFDSKEENTKMVASIALGGIGLGNIKEMLKYILDLIQSKPEYQFLLLNSLKEIILHSDYSTYVIIENEQLIPFLFNFAENSNESLRHIVSECIGKLCSFDLKAHQDLILSNLKSSKTMKKYTIANAYRYFCTKNTPVSDIIPLMEPLVQLINDNDLSIQKVALSSLNNIIYNIPKSVQNIPNNFYDNLALLCKFKPELVREIELGPFKHKVDEGLSVRNAAFSFLDTALDVIYDKIEFSYIMNLIYLGIDDPTDDIQIISYQILNKLATIMPLPLAAVIDKLIDKLDQAITKFNKALSTKQEGERFNDCLRAMLRSILTMSKIPDIESSTKFKEFYQDKIIKNDKLKEIINQLAHT